MTRTQEVTADPTVLAGVSAGKAYAIQNVRLANKCSRSPGDIDTRENARRFCYFPHLFLLVMRSRPPAKTYTSGGMAM